MYDNSLRFNDPTDFNFNGNPTMPCPSLGWIPPPLVNTFYISFSIPCANDPVKGYQRDIYTIEMPSSFNINLYPPTQTNELRINIAGDTRIIVNKYNNQYPNVSISEVWQHKGQIRGFLKIETSVMQPYKKDEEPVGGHAFLKVIKKEVIITPQTDVLNN